MCTATRSSRAFTLVMLACAQFVVLTVVAMLLYPGGTRADPTTSGYSFTRNFFSDLGLTQALSGRANTPSLLLFMVALTLAGAGLILHCVASLRFFSTSKTESTLRPSRLARLLSWLGCPCGIASGAGFIGVAFAPANLWLPVHGWFVMLAFQAFLPAALAFAGAILFTKGYPRRYAWVYLGFAFLLAGYVLLLRLGPQYITSQGLVIQAVGQKVIVYASLVTVFLQAWGARRLASP